jgi:hypothetical protein
MVVRSSGSIIGGMVGGKRTNTANQGSAVDLQIIGQTKPESKKGSEKICAVEPDPALQKVRGSDPAVCDESMTENVHVVAVDR